MSNRSRIPKRLGFPSAAAVAVLALTACGGDSGESTPGSGSDDVSVVEVDGRSVLATVDGLPLYISEEEQASGDVLCVSDGCVAFWEPLTVESGMPTGSVDGELGTVMRPDGATQVTLDGAPLYTFADDSLGQINGDGLSDTFDGQTLTWQVAETGGGSGGNDQRESPGGEGDGGGIYDY